MRRVNKALRVCVCGFAGVRPTDKDRPMRPSDSTDEGDGNPEHGPDRFWDRRASRAGLDSLWLVGPVFVQLSVVLTDPTPMK